MFSKSTAPKIIAVTLEYVPELYGDEKFCFPCKRTTRGEQDKKDQHAAIDNTTNPLDWLAEMLVFPPIGFADFPLTAEEKATIQGAPITPGEPGALMQERIAADPEYKAIFEATPADERPLRERVRYYFLDPARLELLDIVENCKSKYYYIVLPRDFFRNI